MSTGWNLPPGVTPKDIDDQYADGPEESLGLSEFVELTKRVREAQCKFFRTGSKIDLAIAKKLESELDREIALQENAE